MRMLTARGMLLAERLRGEGWTVIEGYPGGAQDVWGIPRKGTDLGGLRRGLVALGLRFRPAARSLTHDQLDSACCAVVGWQFLRGRALALGDPLEGLLYLPGPGPPLGRRKPPRNRARSEPTRYTHAPRRPR
jgi:predicted nuclease with RNAse H fold